MTVPRFAGSALYRASCPSPTDSKMSPHSQTASPAYISQDGPPRWNMPAWTGAEISQMSAACSRNTLRNAYAARLRGALSSISAYRGSSPRPRLRHPIYAASLRPQTTVTASSRYLRVPLPCPEDRAKATPAMTANPSPHTASTTLYRPTFNATANVASNSATTAAAHTANVSTTTPVMRGYLVQRGPGSRSRWPNRQNLMHTHPALVERQRTAGQVQAPHPGRLRADQRGDLVLPLFQRGQPGADRPGVVLAHRPHADDLEAGPLNQGDRLSD